MSGAIEAIDADRAALLEISRGLTDELWQAPSGCAGWRVQDLVAHLANLFWLVVDPAALPDTAGLPTEAAQELAVRARRDWSAADVLADYEAVSKTGLDRLAELAGLDGFWNEATASAVFDGRGSRQGTKNEVSLWSDFVRRLSLGSRQPHSYLLLRWLRRQRE